MENPITNHLNCKMWYKFKLKDMKFLVLVVIISGIGTLFSQKPVFTTAKISEVTLYLNSAELGHTANVNLKKGTNEIVIKNVANTMDNNSIRVKANKDVVILSAAFSNQFFNEYEIDPNSIVTKQVRDSIKWLEKQIKRIDNQVQADQQTLQLMNKNQNIGGNEKGVSVEELMKMVKFYREKQLELTDNIDQLAEKKQKHTKDVYRLKNQLTISEKDEEKLSNGKVVLQVMSESAQNVTFEFSYISSLASWVPSYEVEAKGIDKPLSLTTKGKVRQNTGVDWKQVHLSLSSTQPNPSNAIPKFSYWELSYNEPRNNNQYQLEEVQVVAYKERLTRADVQQSPAQGNSMSKTAADYTVMNEQVLSINYDVKLPYDIISNGKEHTVTLTKQEVPATFNYYAAPKLNKDAYLIASIADYSKFNLLQGEASIIFEGMYVGKTVLNPSSTEDTLKIALGVDKNVVVERTKVAEKSGNKFLSTYKESSFNYEITVRNNKKQPINLILKDQYPLSRDKDIVVEILERSRGNMDDAIGTLTWNLAVKAQDATKIKFGYKVKYPKDKVLWNL